MPLTQEFLRSLAKGRTRARVAALLLAATSLGLLALAAVLGWESTLLARIVRHEPVDGPLLRSLVPTLRWLGGVTTAVHVATAVAFLAWLHRAVVNANALLDDGVVAKLKPGSAVLSFFIPVANLVTPMLTMRDLDRAADPESLPLPVEYVDDPGAGYRSPARREVVTPWQRVRAPVAAWWLLYIVPNLVERLFLGGAEHRPLDEQVTWIAVAAALCASNVVAGVLAIAVVRGIDARLAERARRFGALPGEAAATL